MLFECAIEPAVIFAASRSKRDYRDFIKAFSIGQPIVISDYPVFKRLNSLLRTATPDDFDDNDHMRLVELIAFMREALRVSRSGTYNRALEWGVNLKTESARVPFDHVLTNSNYGGLPCATLEQVFDDSLGHARQLPVTRTAIAMTGAISNMLRLASKIVFVDPYFRNRPQTWNPFVRFVEAAVTNKPSNNTTIEVLFNAAANLSPPANYLADKFINEQPALASQCSLTFKAIEEIAGKEKLHNRYILTNIGGVFFGVGLAEEDEAHQDDVSLLDKQLYELRWRQYAELSDFQVKEQSSV